MGGFNICITVKRFILIFFFFLEKQGQIQCLCFRKPVHGEGNICRVKCKEEYVFNLCTVKPTVGKNNIEYM